MIVADLVEVDGQGRLRYRRLRVAGPHAVRGDQRTANPVVKAVLSSPLHPLLSHGLALIAVTGRRSGRRYTFPGGYRQDGDRVIVNVGWPERKRWWRNLRHGGRVEMRIRGERRAGHAQAHGDERSGVTVEVKFDPDLGELTPSPGPRRKGHSATARTRGICVSC